MGLISTPFRGLLAVFEKIAERAEEELYDEEAVRTELTEAYQQRLARASFRDFVQVLDLHGIRPWTAIAAWTVPLRCLKAWVAFKAWRGPAERIRWQGAIGQFEGRAAISRTV